MSSGEWPRSILIKQRSSQKDQSFFYLTPHEGIVIGWRAVTQAIHLRYYLGGGGTISLLP